MIVEDLANDCKSKQVAKHPDHGHVTAGKYCFMTIKNALQAVKHPFQSH